MTPLRFVDFSEEDFTVRLSDGKTYAYRVGDITRLMLWAPGCEVEMSVSEENDVYPIEIRRVDYDEDGVLARDPSSPTGLPEDLEGS